MKPEKCIKRIGLSLKHWLGRLSFRTGVIVLIICIPFYIISFAQMALPISVKAKSALWVTFFGLAKTFQYGGLTILGAEGIKRLKLLNRKLFSKTTKINETDMDEWDKMQAHQIYDDFDADLFNRRVEAKKLFKEFNLTTDDETEKRQEIMKKLFKKVGERVFMEPNFTCEFGKNITLGNDLYINFGCTLLDCGQITIGNNTLLGPNVSMYSANHSLDAQERIDGALIPEPITIGNRVWIGGGSTILSGVTIGDDSVIGAGSVVTKDIPAGVVAAGNPCRVIRKITEQDKIGFQKRR